MKRSLKAAFIAVQCLFVLQSVACFAEPAARQIAFNPESSALDSARAQARAYFSAKNFAEAVRVYATICRTQSVTANDYYWLGESQYHLGAYANAASSFDYALQLSPNTESLYVRLAETYIALSRFDRLHEICVVGLGLVKDPYVRSQLQSLNQVGSSPARRTVSKSQRSLRVE